MANPQKELGHTSIANDLWEALCRAPLPGRQRRVFDAIIRKTWGWNKKADVIALSQIATMTGLNRNHVANILRWLKEANMVVRDASGKTSIQKDFDRWVLPSTVDPRKVAARPEKVLPPKVAARSKRLLPPKVIGATVEGNQVLPPAVPSKDTITKDTIQKTFVENVPPAPLENQVPQKPTPREETIQFFEEDREPTIQYLISHGIPEKVARIETQKFVDYWTEQNQSGTRQRWQMEKTFEVKRRFVTWMQRVSHDRRSSNLTQEPKGIAI